MWFLYLMSWVSTVIQICFVTLAIAAGLYYLAELVEEYTSMTVKVTRELLKFAFVQIALLQVIRWMIVMVIGTYICLFFFEDLPVSLILCGLIAQVK